MEKILFCYKRTPSDSSLPQTVDAKGRPLRRLLLALVFVLCGLAGSLTAYLWFGPDTSLTAPLIHRAEFSTHRDDSPSVATSTTSEELNAFGEPVRPPATFEASLVGESSRVDSEEPVTLNVLCVDPIGAPVPDVSIFVRISPPQRRGQTGSLLSQSTRAADHVGSLALTSASGNLARLTVEEPSWFANDLVFEFRDSTVVKLVLYPAKSLRVFAQYDDGEPVTYMGSFFRAGSPGVKERDNWDFALSSEGRALVPRVAVDQPLSCKIFGWKRAGYDNETVVFSPNELTAGRELRVIVSRDTRPLGAIRFEFIDGAPGFAGSVRLEGPFYTTSVNFGGRSSSVDASRLSPGTGFRATIMGPKAWRSGPIEVVAFEVTVVKVQFQQGATVTARLLDTQGKPIEHGVLRVSDGDYLQYLTARRPERPRFLKTAEDGVVTLSGIPPGEIQLEAEAWGKVPVVKTLSLQPASNVDLGDLVLLDGSGEVNVHVTGMREGHKYSAYVGQPKNGGNIYPFVPVVDGKCVIRGLPLRSYYIGVTFTKGGRVVAQRIELSESRTSIDVYLDVSDIDP
ncbi:MAG: hypothetical protein KF754_06065 [Planctomycetes bacterium]|nr:hypothetical protein [Planctomycetota bacterium]